MEESIFVMFGDFTFIEQTRAISNSVFLDINPRHRILADNIPHNEGDCKTIINRVDEILLVPACDLDRVCEEGLLTYESYLVPSEYTGAIEMR